MVTIRRAKMVARFRTLLTEEGLSPDWVQGLAPRLAAILWEDYGPGTHYLESLRLHGVQARNERIRRAYDGSNGAEIARREGITLRQLQRILASTRGHRRVIAEPEREQIRKAFNGRNAADLARRHGTTEDVILAIAGQR